MRECPSQPNKFNCALVAAQDLVDKQQIVINYTQAFTSSVTSDGIHIHPEGRSALEVFTPLKLEARGLTDVMTVGCIACEGNVEVVDDDGDMTVERFN